MLAPPGYCRTLNTSRQELPTRFGQWAKNRAFWGGKQTIIESFSGRDVGSSYPVGIDVYIGCRATRLAPPAVLPVRAGV